MLARALAVAALMIAFVSAPPAPTPSARIYDSDPSHLWNRLHAAIFARTAPDGRLFGVDRVDPLLWRSSTYLLSGSTHQQVAALLDEFVATRGERLIDDPLKRAVLQRDLWTVFDWLEAHHNDDVRGAERLRGPLATAIGRLSLTRARIQELPDTYAAAAAAGLVPGGMFADDGPWVSVGRLDGPVAIRHVRDDGPGRNSAFFVFINLPGGRAATLGFLERLRRFTGPLWAGDAPNPELPGFPIGTRVALVRRALLIDSRGDIIVSPVTELVQLRTYTAIRPMTPHEFQDAMRIDESMFERAGQTFEEYSLSRAALFAGRAGGLRPLDEEPFFLTFGSQGVDHFDVGNPIRGLDGAAARRVCKDCHAPPGVYSFNSYLEFRTMRPSMAAAHRPARLAPIRIADTERTAIAWKTEQADWRALRALLPR